MKIDIRAFQCVEETRGVGSDEVVLCVAALGVSHGGTYAEYRRFGSRLGEGLDDGDTERFDEPIEFFARAEADGRPSYPLRHLEFHVAAWELDGRGENETLARRVYERWLVALLEAYPVGRATPWLREQDRDDSGSQPESWFIGADWGTAHDGMEIARDQTGDHQLVVVDAWRFDLLNDPQGETFGAPGVGQSNGLYVAPEFNNITRSGPGVERWSNDERISERRRYFNRETESTYSFYVNYWA